MPLFRTLMSSIALANTPLAAAPSLAGAASERLQQLQAEPTLAGVQVYRGQVARLAARTPIDSLQQEDKTLFTYARHVLRTDDALAASHLTYDPVGALLIEERVTISHSYTFHRMDVANQQTGHSGSVERSADGRALHYTWTAKGTTRTATETIGDALLVAGPNLHGTVLHHWESLHAGQPLRVRLVVPDRQQSYDFNVQLAPLAQGQISASTQGQAPMQTVFIATPASFLLRLAVAPLRMVFDSADRTLLRYEGRVPPMALGPRGSLQDLDARVLYTPQPQGYQ